MRKRTKKWLARLALPLVLAVAGCPAPSHTGDDDDNDDSAATDDDTVAGDDDTAADDDTTAGDDDNMDDYGPRSDDGSAPYHPDFG